MRIAMVTWEYPPRVVGGISPHVGGLSRALARAGHDVTVLTLAHPGAADDEVVDGVRVLRCHTELPWLPEDNFLARMASVNHHLVQLRARLGSWWPDVVHAHDWLVAWAGDTLRTLWSVPLVSTIHATERGRQGGHIPAGQPSGINATEWWLTYQSRQIICCSSFMVDETVHAFQLPREKVHLVPNGVDADDWAPPVPAPRRGEEGPLVVSWGRVQYEKGFQTLVEAVGHLRHDMPRLRAVVAGRGSYLDELRHLAHVRGAEHHVQFPGFVTDDELQALLHRASAVVIPSLYEPFGIVALEALASGAPLVAAASGGLVEVLEGTGAALLYPPGDVDELVHQLRRVLTEPSTAINGQRAGATLVRERYSWDAVAEATLPIYRAALVD